MHDSLCSQDEKKCAFVGEEEESVGGRYLDIRKRPYDPWANDTP